MFNNLIESSSHAREFKRRGSFVLFTTATYMLLFVVAGVMSIYAYDAQLDYQNTEIVTMLNPVELPAAPLSISRNAPPPRSTTNRATDVVRQVAMASVNHPEIVPETTSATPNKNLPVPDHGTYKIGDHDSGPVEPGGTRHTTAGTSSSSACSEGNQQRSHYELGTHPAQTALSPDRKAGRSAWTCKRSGIDR